MKKTSSFLLLCSVSLFAKGVPVAPTNIGIYNITETSARMSFKDLSTDENGFRVYHKTDKIADIPSKEGSDTYQYANLSSLEPCTLYTINLASYNDEGESNKVPKSFRTKGCSDIVILPIKDIEATLNKEVKIEAKVLNPKEHSLSYQWKKGGELLPTTLSFTYTPTEVGTDTLILIVKDNDTNKSLSRSIQLIVTDESSEIPKAPINIGVYNIKGTSARISFKDMSNNEDGFRIFDENNSVLVDKKEGKGSYQYKTLENLETCTLYKVKLVAYNGNEESTPLLKTFKTKDCVIREYPIAVTGPNRSITIGDDVLMEGSGIDYDGNITSYLWTEEGTDLNVTTATFTYHPKTTGVHVLTLKVTDERDFNGTDEVKVFVGSDIPDRNCSIPRIDITDPSYGAIPNDNIDDTEAIKKALNETGAITMPTGVYIVKDLDRNGTTIIEGNGSTFKTNLTNAGTSNNILTLKGDCIHIRNLLLDGNAPTQYPKQGNSVASLLHIYDSQDILLENISIENYNSQNYKDSMYNKMNSDHTLDMFHDIFIAFSRNIELKNIKQKNIKVEGPLIYESDDIKIRNFYSAKSVSVWTALHVVASDNILLEHVNITDGLKGSTGSSVNFFANHHFTIKDVNVTNKHGFDISNEVDTTNIPTGRVKRDTSYGTFENCRFESYHPVQAYPTKNQHEDITFTNVKFIPTRIDKGAYGVRFQKSGTLTFDNCSFGNPNIPSRFNMIMGDVQKLTIKNSEFINTKFDDNGANSSFAGSIYVLGSQYGELNIKNNSFSGTDYTPAIFKRIAKEGTTGKVEKFIFLDNTIEDENELHYGTSYKNFGLPIDYCEIDGEVKNCNP